MADAAEAIDAFARLARALTEHLLDGEALPLQARVEGLHRLLPALWMAAAAFPPVPALPRPGPGPGAPAWPGLGRFDGEPDDGPTVSERVLQVEAWLWAGLVHHDEGDAAAALTVWASGYPDWSVALVGALPALHGAALRFRPEPTLARERPTATPTLVGGGDAPSAVPVVPAPAPAVKAALGVRFEAIGLGAWVIDVHPEAPAAAHLQNGDVVLAVDDRSLEHVDPHVLAERMVGPVGQERTYQVYRDGETFEARFASVPLADLLQE